NQLPKGFNPKDISHRLLRNDTELTLLGTALINPKSYMVGKADKVIQTISNLLKTDSETDKITSQEISQKTKISESDVGAILQMLSEIGYYHTGGIIGDNNDLSVITIDDKTFDRYIEYPNFKECLDAVIEDIKYPKDNN
ncbi:hypothetical protein G3V73_24050, partial [Escherichia coli]|nr:hypothetical protein [Escherichia coli]